jgi:hypothetical protein
VRTAVGGDPLAVFAGVANADAGHVETPDGAGLDFLFGKTRKGEFEFDAPEGVGYVGGGGADALPAQVAVAGLGVADFVLVDGEAVDDDMVEGVIIVVDVKEDLNAVVARDATRVVLGDGGDQIGGGRFVTLDGEVEFVVKGPGRVRLCPL